MSVTAAHVLDRVDPAERITLDFPPAAADRPRYGHGRPPHARLQAILAHGDERYREQLDAIASYRDELLSVPVRRSGPLEPWWCNAFLLGLDSASLYTFIRRRQPARYVEVGSGVSTRWVDRARRDGRTATRITAIDPQPREAISGIADDLVALELERADLTIFASLEAGDVVFVDGSHRVFMNSDATTFFLDVLPELAPGVLVGVHDIFLPADYLPEWGKRYYSEQYLLATWLLADGARIHPVLPCHYVGEHPTLAKVLAPLWSDPRLAGVDPRGFTFWLQTGPAA